MNKCLSRDAAMVLPGVLGLGLFMGRRTTEQISGLTEGKGRAAVREAHGAPEGNSKAALDSSPVRTTVNLSGLLNAPESLERRKEFLNWLSGVKAGNWKES